MLNIALVVGSTRKERFSETVAQWVANAAAKRGDLSVEQLDLRDADLPFFDEPAPPLATGGEFENPRTRAWAEKLERYDGFIATVAEYNYGPTAVLKNAFDSALTAWRRKPIGFVGYGGVGGARAIEQLRPTATGLRMAAIGPEVNIAADSFMAAMQGKPLAEFDHLNQALNTMFDEFVWWGNALKAARDAG